MTFPSKESRCYKQDTDILLEIVKSKEFHKCCANNDTYIHTYASENSKQKFHTVRFCFEYYML